MPPTEAAQEALWRSLLEEIPTINHPDVPRKGNRSLFHDDLLPALAMPRRRNIVWNPSFGGKLSHLPKYPQNILAAVTYITGKEADEPCTKCQRGSGPFVGCILPPDSLWESTSHKACANCIYGWQKKTCTHYPSEPRPGSSAEPPQNRDWMTDPESSEPGDNIVFSEAHLAGDASANLGVVNKSRMFLSTCVVAPGNTFSLDGGDRRLNLGIVRKGTINVEMEGSSVKVETGEAFRPSRGDNICQVRNPFTVEAQVLVLTLEETGR